MGEIVKFIEQLCSLGFDSASIVFEGNEVMVDLDKAIAYIEKNVGVLEVVYTYFEALSFKDINENIVVVYGFC